MKASIKEWLDCAGFDWDNGAIVVHPTDSNTPGWDKLKGEPQRGGRDHPLVTREFDSGFGGPECPRFFAAWGTKVAFPVQYDGATGCTVVDIRPEFYLEGNETPYPGG